MNDVALQVNKMKMEKISKMMLSEDYKERFKGEYHYILLKIQNLKRLLEGYEKGELEWTPVCPYDLLRTQYFTMQQYFIFLERRAQLEKVNVEMNYEDWINY